MKHRKSSLVTVLSRQNDIKMYLEVGMLMNNPLEDHGATVCTRNIAVARSLTRTPLISAILTYPSIVLR